MLFLLRFRLHLAWTFSLMVYLQAPLLVQAADAPEKTASAELAGLLNAANKVLAQGDNVTQAKQADKIFAAAHGLMQANLNGKALSMFQQGLQLSPWRLGDQLAYAGLLVKENREAEARETARMVERISESDLLFDQARKILQKPEPLPLPGPDDKMGDGAWICLVRVGPVNRCVLQDGLDKLEATLGIPVKVLELTLPASQPSRNAFDRWVRQQVSKRLKWDSPVVQQILAARGVDVPDKLNPEQILEIYGDLLKQSGMTAELEQLTSEAAFFRTNAAQWDAQRLTDLVAQKFRGEATFKKAVLIGITELDLYGGDSNFLFGSALIGGGTGVVSYARYRADFWQEPQDRRRLMLRMHKQLLSTIGLALGVPRPTDPTSARSYPASLPEHDAKSEYMSGTCIAGFEKALQVKLPLLSHKPND